YYPHNVHFLWSSSTMEGRSALAMESARKVAEQASHGHMHVFLNMQDLGALPYYAMVRFGKWEEMLAEPQPNTGEYQLAMWYYARGAALAASGRFVESAGALAEVRSRINHPSLAEMRVGFDSAATVLTIAAHALAGELAARRGDTGSAIAELRKAVELQDSLAYNEPESFHYPVRHSLGAVLLEAKRPVEAERVYRRSLETHRNNGWSLLGLSMALRDQGRQPEADEVTRRFYAAWTRADVRLPGSRF
ncbi:MAG: hypothetical protein MI867_21005, partial [Pseudomonadales bacterium]|nr:hypothetical protein [Pseudomonadales bacterium]